jgi:uncharacterized protein YyaL (SSP411 family)
MSRESFSDPAVSKLLDELFVCIRVGREERPDLNSLYMRVANWATGEQGWPLNLFLTPDLRPFFAATYLPAEARYGLPSFSQLLRQLSDLWAQKDSRLNTQANEAVHMLAQENRHEVRAPKITLEDLHQRALKNFEALYDQSNGGFGKAPKFFYFDALRLWWKLSPEMSRTEGGGRSKVIHSLLEMTRGGVYDLVSGGLYRHSMDASWTRPHFEFHLLENAQFIGCVSEILADEDSVFQNSEEAQVLRFILERSLSFVLRHFRKEEGDYRTSLCADFEGARSALSVWNWGSHSLAEWQLQGLSKFFASGEETLVDGERVLRLKEKLKGSDLPQLRELLDSLQGQRWTPSLRLQKEEASRMAYNSLLISAFLKAADALQSDFWKQEAKALGDRLRSGELPKYLPDLSLYGLALEDLMKSGTEGPWKDRANQVAVRIQDQHWDAEQGGFWFAPQSQEDLLLNFKERKDTSMPSAESLTYEFLKRWNQRAKDSAIENICKQASDRLWSQAEAEVGSFTRFVLATADRTD